MYEYDALLRSVLYASTQLQMTRAILHGYFDFHSHRQCKVLNIPRMYKGQDAIRGKTA